ncbi:toll/interleukin-1 receptor domain-containing protein [Geomonas ferrireducens]|uniref:toll/interleukin-1 receptor domain-containing protein n=1 Tax=Geomonas ferrireducens TaxID=2570227 RepID=UPI0013A5DF62|nr:TIR domain-containing protein [Geomonas ferrireducens]
MNEQISGFKYDITVSFAGEDRLVVEQFVNKLNESGVRVFFDSWEQANLWGKDLYQHLDEVYRKSARFCVVFISQHYAAKAWTSHELRSAQARAFRDNAEYILPIKIDDTELLGLPPTIGYLDLRKVNVESIASLVLQKLHAEALTPILAQVATTTTTPAPTPPGFRIPRIGRANLDPVQEAYNLVAHIETVIDQRIPVLREAGLTVSKTTPEGSRLYRITYNQRLIYFFRMAVGSSMGAHILSFLDGWNEPSTANAATAYGEVQQTISQKEPSVSITNLSLLETPGVSVVMTYDELADSIWQKSCNVIESIMNR